MDLSKLKPQPNYFQPKHPVTEELLETDSGVPVQIKVVGVDSSEHYKAQMKTLQEMREYHLQNKDDEEKSFNSLDDVDEDLVNKWTNEALLACIVGWDEEVNEFFVNEDTINGTGEYSRELLEKIFNDHDFKWLKNQIDDYLKEREHFFLA